MRSRLYLPATIGILGVAILFPGGLTQPGRATVDLVTSTLRSNSEVAANNAQSYGGTAELHEGAAQLHEGAAQLHEGAAQLHEGAAQLHEGAAQLHEGTSIITVRFEGSNFDLRQSDLLKWLQQAAHSVSTYYRQFPVSKLLVRVTAVPGDHVGFSTADDDDGHPVIHYRVGTRVAQQALDEDWVATHEMVHLAFPLVGDKRWVAEGIATYVEPVAREQAGNITARELWGQLVENMPRGLPAPGDRGLNSSRSIRRTYWGGALFYLLADIEIRKQTHNRKGLQDALVAVMRAGGDIDSDWEVARAFQFGDRAVGVHVLERMYKTWKHLPVNVNLAQTWSDLGVLYDNKAVSFNEKAPFASVRRAIEAGQP